MPRLVRLDEYRTETYMDGNLLIFNHSDIPGIIGYVGSVLAEEQVNIAQMAVGREGDQGGSADRNSQRGFPSFPIQHFNVSLKTTPSTRCI